MRLMAYLPPPDVGNVPPPSVRHHPAGWSVRRRHLLLALACCCAGCRILPASPTANTTDGSLEASWVQWAHRPATVVVLRRHQADAQEHRRLDAIVVSRDDAPVRIIRQMDDDHELLLRDPEGRAGRRLTPEAAADYERQIREHHLAARAVTDGEGQEVAVVYLPHRWQMVRRIDGRGRIHLHLADPLSPARASFSNPLPPRNSRP